jgi:hypothetical protein
VTFKPAIWYPITVVLSVINVAGAGLALAQAQPSHAAIHAGLALAFGSWAQLLRRRPAGSELDTRLAALEDEESKLRQQLSETQERLDFVERLAQEAQARRVGPRR